MSVEKLYRVGEVAKQINIPRTTILAAIDRREIVAQKTGCGLPLIDLDAAKRWKNKKRRPGPKKKAKK